MMKRATLGSATLLLLLAASASVAQEVIHVVLAQVPGEPLDLVRGLVCVLGDRSLTLPAQLLAGLPERRLYGGHPLGGLVLLVGQLALDLLPPRVASSPARCLACSPSCCVCCFACSFT